MSEVLSLVFSYFLWH